jgi:hypothetical protein
MIILVPIPLKSVETDFRVDFLDVFSSGATSLDGVKLGDHSISRLRDQSAEDTSNVTRHEGDGELSTLGVFALGLSENFSVEKFDSLFESDELHDGVGDLSSPERSQTLEQTVGTFISSDLVQSGGKVGGESTGLRGLDSDLDGFPRTEEAISNNFSGGRSNSPTNSLVFNGVFLTDNTGIDILEHFVETEFTQTLEGVSDKGGGETEGETSVTFSSLDGGEGVTEVLVQTRVNLHSALDDIKRADGSVGKTTGQGTSDHTLEVVRSVVNVFLSNGGHL